MGASSSYMEGAIRMRFLLIEILRNGDSVVVSEFFDLLEAEKACMEMHMKYSNRAFAIRDL